MNDGRSHCPNRLSQKRQGRAFSPFSSAGPEHFGCTVSSVSISAKTEPLAGWPPRGKPNRNRPNFRIVPGEFAAFLRAQSGRRPGISSLLSKHRPVPDEIITNRGNRLFPVSQKKEFLRSLPRLYLTPHSAFGRIPVARPLTHHCAPQMSVFEIDETRFLQNRNRIGPSSAGASEFGAAFAPGGLIRLSNGECARMRIKILFQRFRPHRCDDYKKQDTRLKTGHYKKTRGGGVGAGLARAHAPLPRCSLRVSRFGFRTKRQPPRPARPSSTRPTAPLGNPSFHALRREQIHKTNIHVPGDPSTPLDGYGPGFAARNQPRKKRTPRIGLHPARVQ